MLDEDTVATHRIIEVVPDGKDPSVLCFHTKGNAAISIGATLLLLVFLPDLFGGGKQKSQKNMRRKEDNNGGDNIQGGEPKCL